MYEIYFRIHFLCIFAKSLYPSNTDLYFRTLDIISLLPGLNLLVNTTRTADPWNLNVALYLFLPYLIKFYRGGHNELA